MRRLLFNFLKYFIDHLEVNLLLIKYYFINSVSLFPRIAKLGQKYNFINNIAICWQLIGEIINKFLLNWDRNKRE